MATFWFETCVEGYFWWKLPVGRQFKSLEEYSPLKKTGVNSSRKTSRHGGGVYGQLWVEIINSPTALFIIQVLVGHSISC